MILAWVGSRCGIPSPCSNDDGEWNGYELGDTEPCVLCVGEACVARVIDWQAEGDTIAVELAGAERDAENVRTVAATVRAEDADELTLADELADAVEDGDDLRIHRALTAYNQARGRWG